MGEGRCRMGVGLVLGFDGGGVPQDGAGIWVGGHPFTPSDTPHPQRRRPSTQGITILLDPSKTQQIQKLAVSGWGWEGWLIRVLCRSTWSLSTTACLFHPSIHPSIHPQLRDPCLRNFPGEPLTSPEVVLMLALVSLYASFMFFAQVGDV